MIKKFTTTIELDNRKLHLPIDNVILEHLKLTYEKTCYEQVYIIAILEVVSRGDVVFSRNLYPTVPQCDVIFSASIKTFSKGDYIALTITDVTDKTIICKTPEYIASIDKKYLPKPEKKVLAVIGNVSYQRGYKIAFIAIPYFRPKLSFGTRCVVPHSDEEDFIKAIDNIDIANKLETAKKHINFKDYSNISPSFNYEVYNYKTYKNIKKYAGQEVLLIIDVNYNIDSFYIAPGSTQDKNIHIICEATTAYHVVYKYFQKLSSLLDAINEL